ncbi:MAG: PAS domain S-box protein [Phenylobacterium sp.]|uniref:hybrid sensor histidine kinase/response regulator n=1 Tax=Phenylobacterium sp. TaxID=1871053 RepID=UPI00391D8D9D
MTRADRDSLHADLAAAGAENVLAAMIASSLDGVVVIDAAGRVLEFNPAAEETFGYGRAEALGRPIGELIVPPDLRGAHTQGLAAYLEGRAPRVIGRRVEVRAMRRGGEEFPAELTINEVSASGRRLFTAYIRDLSAAKAAEAARRRTEGLLASLLDHAPAPIYLKDLEGRYALANPATGRLLGVEAAEIVGKRPDDFFTRTLLDPVDAADAEMLRTGEPVVIEQTMHVPGGPAQVLMVRFPVRGVEGQITHIGGYLVDITSLKHAEAELTRSREALHQSEKLNALGSLLAGVSHELNNPLSVVVGQSLMLEEAVTDPQSAERAAMIRRAAERCSRIVQTFLAMARQKPPARTALDLNQTVSMALELAEYGLRTGDVEVRRDLAAGLPPADADPDQISQVVINLVLNAQQALQASEGARVLTVRTRHDPGAAAVVVEVSDNGPGVAPEIRSRIFEPFYTTKPQGQGTGVGLSFSLGVVEAHGGRLELVTGEGRGATFRLTLPAAQARETAPEASQPEGRPARRATALIVDDEPDIARTLQQILAADGWEAEVAGSARAAMACLQAQRFDLVLSDLRMADGDGPALYAWLETHRPELCDRLAFVTGDTLGAAAGRFLARTGRPVLEKPFTPDRVRGLARSLHQSAGQGETK